MNSFNDQWNTLSICLNPTQSFTIDRHRKMPHLQRLLAEVFLEITRNYLLYILLCILLRFLKEDCTKGRSKISDCALLINDTVIRR